VSANELRLVLLAVGILLLLLIYWFGRPRQGGAERRGRRGGSRREPRLQEARTEEGASSAAATSPAAEGTATENGIAGRERPRVVLSALRDFERVVVLYVVAETEEGFAGSDVVVACEKLGLVYGEGEIFHRLPEGQRESAPLFSVASMVEPGSFDLANLETLRVPGLCVFMAIPGPRPALDQWEAMLPAAGRLAGLLGGRLLDERMNALGRQGIAHVREELRAFDRRMARRRFHPRIGGTP
jgi:cell division protein ZipA